MNLSFVIPAKSSLRITLRDYFFKCIRKHNEQKHRKNYIKERKIQQ